ncbi:LANO_0F09648g1_1 [Lachancea nothofagi CBS 11611]|uniref:Required for respiratory growth protein 8, mitochondrial n=1 Tax=Lachancea nothofagi CBS 11611 TaxID=1266666 RepID=A0A1G4KA23_9SACH|nr:LANO_0F09648g1_1 [Lachancea nothofagi CBS 11611]
MGKSEALAHTWENLIGKRLQKTGRAAHKPECERSPLISNFEKWAGKPRKLYFRSVDSVPRPSYFKTTLKGNLFAQLLSSPMRLDKLTRVRAPKELLLQVKLVDKSDDGKKSFGVDSYAQHFSGGPTSYVSNNETLLRKQGASFMKWVPTSSLNATIRHISHTEILQPSISIAELSKRTLIDKVHQGLLQISNRDVGRDSQNYDIRVISDSGLSDKLIVDSKGRTTLNFGHIDDPTLQGLFKGSRAGIFLEIKNHKVLCFMMYKLLAFVE